MSTIEVNKITPVSGGTTVQVGESGDTINIPAGATIANAGTSTGFGDSLRPNANPLIINGNMAVAQRGTSATGKTTTGIYTVDRMSLVTGSIGTYTVAQESQTSGNAFANGFANAWRLDCTTADASPSASEQLEMQYTFEGQDLQVFKKGTANAEKFTLAFWVKSNKTGTGNIQLKDKDNSNRQCTQSYTISSANTWEHKVCVFGADTTGAFDDDNAKSLIINWWLGSGTDYSSGTANHGVWEAQDNTKVNDGGTLNINDNTANDWSITGIQLEVGEYTSSTLPPFQHESFGGNLARCQRYYFRTPVLQNQVFGTGFCSNSIVARGLFENYQVMRSAPSISRSSGTDFAVHQASSSTQTTALAFYYITNKTSLWYADVSSGLTEGRGVLLIDDGGANAYIEASAEL